MLKLNDATLFDDGNVELLDLDDKGGLTKVAACSDITNFLAKLETVPGKSYIHVNMLGASNIYGSTRNGDYFHEDVLRKYHKTFETNPAKLFKHHRNKAHSPSYGKVIFSTFNENMKRIELVVEVDEEYSRELAALIEMGQYPKTSMACRLPHDRCSICGNIAKNRDEYCTHLKYEMNRVYPDGRKVVAINEDNVSWFDCSIVTVPADPTSSILVKVAELGVIGAAEYAEQEGVTDLLDKTAHISKWSELIKHITEGQVVNHDLMADKILSETRDPPDELIEKLSLYPMDQVLTAMAHLGISPSVSYLSELVARKHLGEGFEGIGGLVEEYVKSIDSDTDIVKITFEEPVIVDHNIYSVLTPAVSNSSLLPGVVEKRASYSPVSGVGYAGLGPNIEPTQQELTPTPPQVSGMKSFIDNHGKLLLVLGVAALIAKYYITSQIEKKMREQSSTHPKIVLTGYAPALQLARRGLMKSAMDNQGQVVTVHEVENSARLATRLANKLINTRTRIGGKISGILKTMNFGFKMHNKLNEVNKI